MPPDKRPLLGAISKNLILELTRRMVEIPSSNPPGLEKLCAEFIFETLQGWGVEVEMVHQPDPERPQVVAWHRGQGAGPTVILNGHTDTVGEGDPEAWAFPPFELTERDGRLYGRGACDMKGSLAVAMAILKTLHDAKARFPGTLMFQAVMGEEMDEDGTKTLLELGYTGDYAIVLEPTDLRLGPGTRGVAWHRVRLTGPSVHCGLAAPDAPDLMYAFGGLLERFTAYHREVAACAHPLIPSPACRITELEAGGTHNDVAGACAFVVDRRMVPGETCEQVSEEIDALLSDFIAEAPAFDYELEFLRGNEPTETPLDSPLIETLSHNAEAHLGRPAGVWGPPYGCDMRNFVCDAGIPTTNFGAGDYRVCHRPDEFVELADLVRCARIVMGTAVDLMRQPGGSAS